MASEPDRPLPEDTVVDSDRLAGDEQGWPVAELYRLEPEHDDDSSLAVASAERPVAPSGEPPRKMVRRAIAPLLVLAVAGLAMLVTAVVLTSRDGPSPEPAASTTPSTVVSSGRTNPGKVTTVPLAPPRVETQRGAAPPAPTKAATNVNVPSLVGRAASDASAALRRAGLRAHVQLVVSDGPAGVVTGQSPAAGSEAPRGSRVLLDVSTARPMNTGVEVPHVVGLDIAAAQRRLRALELTVQVDRESSSEPVGTVLRQSPAAGARQEKRSVITLTVSSGPETVVVPDVVGLDEASARAQLGSAGLAVTVTYEPTSDPGADGTVVAQMPASGASVSAEDGVTIMVAQLE
jgi:hypothetical protein